MVRLWRSPHRSAGDMAVGAADWALAALLVLLSLFAPRTGQPTPDSTTTWAFVLAVVLALGQGLPVAVRRRYPRQVAVCVLACFAGQGLLEGVVPPFAPWVVIWSLGSSRDPQADTARLAAALAAGTCLVIGVAEATRPGIGASALFGLVTVIVALAAVLRRSERGRADALRRRAATEERLRIARDLHDLVGHGLSVVAVQSSTARMALDSGDPATARAAMSAVESSSRTALKELRQMLGVLADGASDAPAPGLAELPALVANVRTGGVPVSLESAVQPDTVPVAVQLAAYRVVQEALTNVMKHAPGSHVAVGVATEQRWLSVTVESRGGRPAPPDVDAGGSGLDGLRARVAALSGDLTADRTPDGWLLRARLPLGEGQGPPRRDEEVR